MIERIKKAFRTIKVKRNLPLHIEFNLTDHCNLNCKGCSHYSPLAPAEFESLHELENSMRRVAMARNAEMIKDVYLIGGETLLYPKLTEAMRMARKYFPWAKISIFTNGLLIPKMDNEFWETCRKEKCVIVVTRYPIKFNYDKIAPICREHGVEVEEFDDRGNDNSFFRFPLDPEKRQNKFVSHFRCMSFGCVTIDHGKIFPCPQSACVGHLNRHCGTDFKWEKGDYIDVNELKDVREILRLRNRPTPFCRYCAHVTVTPYGPSRRDRSEWVK